MHVTEREEFILNLLKERNFISFREIERLMTTSPATLRRDLKRLGGEGKLIRVRGGLQMAESLNDPEDVPFGSLLRPSFQENLGRNKKQKNAIGRRAAAMCNSDEAVMIDGGSTTFHMCPYLENKNLQVLTNSLHIVSALLSQKGTRITVPGGAVFPEQNIILAAVGDDCMPLFHAPKLFLGAASVGSKGLMQADILLVAAERRFIERADEVIVLVDSSKFAASSGNVVCSLAKIDVVITDNRISELQATMLQDAGINLLIAE